MSKDLNRRQFIGLGAAATATLLLNCSSNKSENLNLPPLLDVAPDGELLKAGVIGCGGRGTGAAIDFLNAGPNLTISALGDVFRDRLDGCTNKLKEEKGIDVPETNCFIGFDAFKKVVESGVDIVILATPPHFRPEHFAAAIEAKKHVFMEKPVAVDPVGVRSVMSTAKRAESLGLSVVTGTQRRHSRCYIETYKQIANGTIGEIVSANCYWNQSQLWYRTPKSGWSEM
ncbi:MAG: Gfo/Idh/MocA family oxidoreductase, partial [bacterium]